MHLPGDIYCVRDEGKFLTKIFSIEAKNGYPGASLDLHLKQNKNEIIKDFWDQACCDANNANKLPLVIFKKKGMPNPWLGICDRTFTKLKKYFINIRYINLRWDDELPDIYFMNLSDFLENISPNIIKEEFNEISNRT